MNEQAPDPSAAPRRLPVGIIGGTGYTGGELINLLLAHPVFELTAVTAREKAGTPVAAHWPHLAGLTGLDFIAPDRLDATTLEVVFCATPHAAAMAVVPKLLEAGARVVDLSADFRLRDVSVYEAWYGPHSAPELIGEAVYGLPELNRAAIAPARLVANPGCYPTATLLALLPVVRAGLGRGAQVIVDAKSGVSGAGRKASEALIYGQVAENLAPYGLGGHRHHPEIAQGLAVLGARDARLTFVPHLVPMFRGMEVTVYVDPEAGIDAIRETARATFADEPFIEFTEGDDAAPPSTQSVRGSNLARVAYYSGTGPGIVAVSAIDNLVKGAAGQAVQNANLMCGLSETSGLTRLPAAP